MFLLKDKSQIHLHIYKNTELYGEKTKFEQNNCLLLSLRAAKMNGKLRVPCRDLSIVNHWSIRSRGSAKCRRLIPLCILHHGIKL